MQSKNATTMATRRRNALLVVVIVLIVAGTVAVRLIADRMEDDAAATASRQAAATTQQAPTPETGASATPVTPPQVAPAADPTTTSSPTQTQTQSQTGYVPDGRPADSPTVPLSCAAGETLVTNGVKWTFDVSTTYDQSVLGMAAAELKSFVSALPEADRSIHVRGFAATDGLWTYALGLGPNDATKKIMRCSSTACLFPSITDDESGAWGQLVPSASAAQ